MDGELDRLREAAVGLVNELVKISKMPHSDDCSLTPFQECNCHCAVAENALDVVRMWHV